jgi:hypothetical protein
MVDMENNKMQIPKVSIERIVSNLHVGVSDEEVKRDMLRRVRQNPNVTASMEKRIVAYALKCHHANREFYRSVMSGRF